MAENKSQERGVQLDLVSREVEPCTEAPLGPAWNLRVNREKLSPRLVKICTYLPPTPSTTHLKEGVPIRSAHAMTPWASAEETERWRG